MLQTLDRTNHADAANSLVTRSEAHTETANEYVRIVAEFLQRADFWRDAIHQRQAIAGRRRHPANEPRIWVR